MTREDFMFMVYAELICDPTNNRANRIIEAADEYAEEYAEEQRWIPCSERLPEEQSEYLVTNYSGHVVRYVFNDTASSKEYWRRCAIAWMPLPEPYKGESI